MAPIKRLLSTKNTPPSEKGIPFFTETKFSTAFVLFLPAPDIS
jgi:hypothetical protein